MGIDMPTAILWLLILAIFIPLCLWLVGSVALILYWQFDHESQRELTKKHENWFLTVFVGAFIGCLLLLAKGFEGVLFFIPWSWGGPDESGDFVSIRSTVAMLLGFFLTVAIAAWMGKQEKLREEKRRLEVERDVLKGTEQIALHSPQVITQMRDEYESRVGELYQLDYLSEKRETELQVKQKLLDYLRRYRPE